MKKIQKIFLIAVLVIVLFALTACGKETENKTENNNQGSTEKMSNEDKFIKDLQELESSEIVANAEKQMAEPNEGDTIAILHVDGFGDIKIKFFEDVAPKACENFITHAKEGYYNGVTFHRVMNEFMIQGGDPEGTGMGGETIWGEDIAEELSPTVLPYRGALCMASGGTGTKTIGSQFFIVQANYRELMKNYLMNVNFGNLNESYEKNGGDLYDLIVYAQYTTFGQVIEGMDVVDRIAAVETDPSNDKPLQDVIISQVEVTTYTK